MNWLKHAFALDDGTSAEPTPAQSEAVDRVVREVLRRRLDVPAEMLLEACRPLNFVGAQVIHFFSPLMQAVLGVKGQNDFAEFLEKRKSIDYLLSRFEVIRRENNSSGVDDAAPSGNESPDDSLPSSDPA